MRILRIISTLNPDHGGPGIAIIDNSIELIKKGIQVHIATNDPKKKIDVKNKNLKIFNLGPSFGNYAFNLKLFFWLLKNKKNYDRFIIHGLWEFNTLVARILLRKNYYVFTHGQLDPFFQEQYFKKVKKQIYWFLFERKNLLNSKSIFLTSNAEKQLLNNTYVNTKGIKKKVVPYGINKPFFDKKKIKKKFFKKFPFLSGKMFFLYLGRFHPKKGCDILIKSAKLIRKDKENIKILMVGPDNNLKQNLKKYCKENKLEKNIFWSNSLSGDLKWGSILCCEAMVLASHGENFGVALTEALSCKKGVITTNKVNISKIISKYQAGIIAKNNVKSFSSSLLNYLNLSNSKKKRMSQRALKCFENEFNLPFNINNFIKTLQS